jgi:hypothetical protein
MSGSVAAFLPVGRRRQKVATGSKVLGNEAICRQKPLGMPRRFEPLHPSLTFTDGPVGVLTPIIEIGTLLMLDTWRHLALRVRIPNGAVNRRKTVIVRLISNKIGAINLS